ncbi:MAG: hypothetical protein JNL82_03780 [Myxococcales bacterium]|nr:hypothetical protein [Myxococcales bacterium]
MRPLVLAFLPCVLLGPACNESDPCELRAAGDCAIDDDECLEHVRHVVTCMRGVEHPLPKIERLTADEYLARLPAPAEPTPEEADRAAKLDRAFALLELLPADPGDDDESEPGELALPLLVYDWSRRVVTIVADGSDPEFELFSLVYTLVVADRDAEVGLDALFSDDAVTFDRARALRTLVTGEAQFYADLATWRNPDYRAASDDFAYGLGLDDVMRAFADPEVPWYQAMGAFQYIFGAWTTQGRYIVGGHDDVDAAYAFAGDSTAYALTGGLEIDAAFAAIDTALPEPPAGFGYVSQDSYGPVMWHMSEIRRAEEASDPNTFSVLAEHWVGDRMIVAGETDGERVAVIWQLAAADGAVDETLIVASDAETADLFAELFP